MQNNQKLKRETYTEIDIEKLNVIEDDGQINFKKDAEYIAESDDQGEIQFTNPVKATEAIESLDKFIEANTTDYAGILALQSLREKTVQRSISERKKQTSVREFF